MSKNMRDYGMGSIGKPVGKPTWKKVKLFEGKRPECPNCGGLLCEVELLVENRQLKGGVGKARYLGCPACPWASPAIVASCGDAKEE